jgi:GalNAc-alpha-(1->4)-GalNAc-alpha-(1->3)-diNAcBac-PP-undecaprenol alpha-1,4-N-acetyl-D-galactosaminyltransferase
MLKKMVFVTPSLAGGGAERVLTNLANYFSSQMGYKVDIVYSYRYDEKPAYELEKNIVVHNIQNGLLSPSKGFLNGKKNTYLILKHLRNKFFELEPDVIISFLDKTNIFSILAHFGIKVPLIISERTNFHFLLGGNIWRVIRRIVYPYTDGLVVLSGYDYNKFTYVKHKKVIQNPLNITLNHDMCFEKKEKIILAVGRLDRNKGFHKLINIATKLNLIDWKIYILGDGPEKENLQQQISNHYLDDKVFLLGREDNVFDYYKNASIFTLTSTYEGFPNALAEAMSFGCSCVSFDCITGPSEIIDDNINGYLIQKFDENEMKSKIQYLIDNEDVRRSFFEEAIKIREKLNIEHIAKEWLEFIKYVKEVKN